MPLLSSQDHGLASLAAVVILLAACRASPPSSGTEVASSPHPQDPRAEGAHEPREADPMLDTGIVLRPHEGRRWGLRLLLPVSVAWTELDLQGGLSPEQLTALAVVPTAEFVVPLSEHWTLLPFVGLGGAWQLGDSDLVGGSEVIGLATGGIRATRWQLVSERTWLGFLGEARYDAALEGRDGLLGDWGSFDAALELRRDFGAPREGPRFQGGVYAQVFRFWDPIEIEVPGATPTVVDNQGEVGISLGSTAPYRVWGITLPRVFLGFVVGDGLSGVRLRFGRL